MKNRKKMRNQRLGHKRNFPINGWRMNADPLWVQNDDVRSDVTPFMWFLSLPLCRNSSGTFSKTFHLSTNHKNDLLPTRMNFAMIDGQCKLQSYDKTTERSFTNIWARNICQTCRSRTVVEAHQDRTTLSLIVVVGGEFATMKFMIGRNWTRVVC